MSTASFPSPHSIPHIHQQGYPAQHSYPYASYPYTSVPATVPSAPIATQPHSYCRHQTPDSSPQPQVSRNDSQMNPPLHLQAGPSHSMASDAFPLPDAGHSTSRPKPPPSSATMPMIPTTLPDLAESASHAYVPSNNPAQQQARAANRRSHNPGMALNLPSAPRPEELTDEYVLHPSVYAFKQEYPRRAMVGLGPYIVLQTLGEGEFGKVKLGVHADYGVEVAIKLIRRGDLQEEAHASKVEREINVLKTLKHPNIVRMFDVLDTHKYIGIVLEFAGGGELFEYILANEYLKDKEGQRLFAQLISGVDYLHKKGVIHRDLKLENLLLDRNRNLIITDFGFANQFDLFKGDLMSTSCGSPCYAAPELVVLDTPYSGSAVDIWSCGVILFAMLAGYLPYDDDPDNPDAGNVVELYRYIMNTELNYPEHVSSLGKNLLQHMLILHPEHRIKVPDITVHPWMKPYRHMFDKSVEECEASFQDSMYKKSKQARKELHDRRRVQTQARDALQAREKAFARSQSSAPGTTITASAMDQNRRRPHSALPGAMTLPEIIARHSGPVSDVQVPARSVTPTAIRSTGPAQPIPIESPHRRRESMTPGLSSTAPPVLVPITAEAQPSGAVTQSTEGALESVTTAPIRNDDEERLPMRENQNRHTIQVEYDGEASYDRLKEDMSSKTRVAEGSAETSDTGESGMLAPSLPGVKQSDSSDVEMESGSSDNEHSRMEGIERGMPQPYTSLFTSVPLALPAACGPLATDTSDGPLISSDISTPADQKTDPLGEVANPSTPRASVAVDRDAVNVTPRASKVTAPTTPRASSTNVRRQHGSMPPSLVGASVPEPKATALTTPRASSTNVRRQHGSMPPSLVGTSNPEPKANSSSGLNAAGLPKPPKKDRYRKGMSLDKFGLSKLLGHASQAPSSVDREGRMAPPSASASAVALQHQLSNHTQQENVTVDAESAKKTRRRTLQLGFHSRRDSKAPASIAVPGAPLTDRDINGENRIPASAGATDSLKGTRRKTVQLGFSRQNTRESKVASPPNAPVHLRSAESTSIAQTARNLPIKADLQASSVPGQNSPSAIMVDTFSAQQGYSSSRGSSSKAAKVMDWFRRKALAKETMTGLRSPDIRSDSQSSFVQVGEATSPERKVEDSINPAMTSFESVDRTEEHAADETKTPSMSSPKPIDASSSTPAVTVTPPRPTAATRPASDSTVLSTIASRARSASTYTFDESKIRVHTGLVDQSALSSKPPQDVFKEVMHVLRGMGVDMKRESDFKLRCTRVKKGRVNAPAGLGLGSVVSTGSGMNPFSVMNNASSSKTDARGLPLPTSPSMSKGSGAGIKGLLRRGSSRSSAHPARFARVDAENVVSPSQSTPNLDIPELPTDVKPQPLYGKELMDAGDEVRFTVELCRMKNLPGLYILKIKRTKGNLWSFKFIYQTVIERSTTLTH